MPFKKGMIPWNKGLKGYRFGFKHTEETKKKISKSCTGREVWIAGKNHSEETKQKIREARIKNNPGAFKNKEDHRMWKGGKKAYYGSIARKVWEDFWNQKFPKGHCIHHVDGNIRNNKITNLANMLFGLHSRHHRLKESRSLS